MKFIDSKIFFHRMYLTRVAGIETANIEVAVDNFV